MLAIIEHKFYTVNRTYVLFCAALNQEICVQKR